MRDKRSKLDRSLLYTQQGEVSDDAELYRAALGNDVVISGSGVTMHLCDLRRSTITSAPAIQIRESSLKTVDAASADLERSGWSDCKVAESRFTGARLNSAHIRRCTFSECRMNLMQSQVSTLQEVRFEQCDLRGAYFNGTDMPGTVFEGSDLTGADFSGAVITGCDFRRATIEDIRVAPEQMTGVIVTSDQALYLARLFGLDIQE